jgi:hypothetical protein
MNDAASRLLSAELDEASGLLRCTVCHATLAVVTPGAVIVEGYERGDDGVWRMLPSKAAVKSGEERSLPEHTQFTFAEAGDIIECGGPDGRGCAMQVLDADVFGPIAGELPPATTP